MHRDPLDGILDPVTDRACKLLDEDLGLPDDERAQLAAELLASLPDDPAEDVAEEWRIELVRRARAAHEAPDAGAPWADVRARLLAELGRR
jgi:putative addiction module component (TIGR02574 family)